MSQVHAVIFVGLEHHANGEHSPEFQEWAIAEIEDFAARVAGGFTSERTHGGWYSPEEKRVIREKGLRLDVLCVDEEQAQIIGRFAKQTLNQYSVLVETNQVKGEFV